MVAELDLVCSREESMTLDVTGHYSRPDLFTLDVRRDTRARSAPAALSELLTPVR
jgi:hypothetical protein